MEGPGIMLGSCLFCLGFVGGYLWLTEDPDDYSATAT